ncbi:unnamed protein product [Tetraodon nigroviridis]|uniref:(spotted green pufferfish) hypothetical protein n=1 Tax=Tetraodon nigroviridis TaxID=99883 RepID=Q4SQY4_TETNG|nr:unnamed protein product [Tetraodon nigroviridis]
MKDYRHPILLRCGVSLWTAASIGFGEQCPQDIGGQEEEKKTKPLSAPLPLWMRPM